MKPRTILIKIRWIRQEESCNIAQLLIFLISRNPRLNGFNGLVCGHHRFSFTTYCVQNASGDFFPGNIFQFHVVIIVMAIHDWFQPVAQSHVSLIRNSVRSNFSTTVTAFIATPIPYVCPSLCSWIDQASFDMISLAACWMDLLALVSSRIDLNLVARFRCDSRVSNFR